MKLAALMLTVALWSSPTAVRAAGAEVIPAFEGGPRILEFQATAYTSGPESTGKRPGHPQFGLTRIGTRAREGQTIAVDPSVIPLGSRVYVAELGRDFIAEDTGGAVRGQHIDLYMEKLSDAISWGIRPVHIQVVPKI